jgi:hypothetical protein
MKQLKADTIQAMVSTCSSEYFAFPPTIYKFED